MKDWTIRYFAPHRTNEWEAKWENHTLENTSFPELLSLIENSELSDLYYKGQIIGYAANRWGLTCTAEEQ